MNFDITVILNCFRRPSYLKEQIEAVKNQTIKPKEIWLWVNDHETNRELDFKNYGFDAIVRSSVNFKYHSRFSLGLLARTNYIALFDDDTIPGINWFKNCKMTVEKLNKNAILGSAGVTLLSLNYMHHIRSGWPAPSNNIKKVDLVGHAWFFPKICLHNMWSIPAISLENGEDIQLSAFNQKYDIDTYALAHPPNDMSYWGSLKAIELGTDENASSNGSLMPYSDFCNQRDKCVNDAVRLGWRPLSLK